MEVEFEGALPDRPDTYAVMSSTPTSAKLKATAGSTDQEVLEALVAAGLRIRRYELPEPSLNDIFIGLHTRGEPRGE